MTTKSKPTRATRAATTHVNAYWAFSNAVMPGIAIAAMIVGTLGALYSLTQGNLLNTALCVAFGLLGKYTLDHFKRV